MVRVFKKVKKECRASFQYIRRIPALYILRPKKNLRQLESCPLLRMNEVWMEECAAILQPLVDKYKDPDNTKLSQ